MKKSLFALILSIFCLNAFANYDILFENNTPYTLYINTGTHDNLPDSDYGGWQNQKIKPYQRAVVQWFNFNKDIKYGNKYTFYVEARRSLDDEEPLLTFNTTIKGFVVGSTISESKVNSNQGEAVLFDGEPKPHYSVLVNNSFNNTFGDHQTLDIHADAIKYTVPNPHKDFQFTDAISYVISEKQPQYRYSDNKNELSLVSYNMQVFPVYGHATDKIIMNHPGSRTENIAKLVQNYDVVTVQELFAKDHRETFTEKMLDNYPQHAGPATKTYRPLSSGVVIYSRWPIVDSDTKVFNHCKGIDCGAAKGITYAKIDKYGMRYNIFSTHFQSGSDPSDEEDTDGNTDGSVNGKARLSHTDVEIRRSQIEDLRDFIAEKDIPADEPIIFTGDLNIDAALCYNDNKCEELNDLLNMVNAKYRQHDNIKLIPYSVDGSLDWMNTSGEKNREMLDYILPLNGHVPLKSYHSRVLILRGDSDPLMYSGKPYGDTDLSDHFALEAKLTF